MMMDHWLIHCSLKSIKNKWYGKAFSVENSAQKEHVYVCRNKVYHLQEMTLTYVTRSEKSQLPHTQ